MINKILIWTTVFNIIVNPCVVIDVLADVWVEEAITILVEVFAINARAAVVIDMLSDL